MNCVNVKLCQNVKHISKLCLTLQTLLLFNHQEFHKLWCNFTNITKIMNKLLRGLLCCLEHINQENKLLNSFITSKFNWKRLLSNFGKIIVVSILFSCAIILYPNSKIVELYIVIFLTEVFIDWNCCTAYLVIV